MQTLSAAEHATSLARVSASRSPQDAIAAFAGGALPHTILSCCQGTLLYMFNTRTVLPLRATCRDAAAAVAAYPWDDLETVICGNLGPSLRRQKAKGVRAQRGAWRGCFPRAVGANVTAIQAEDGSPWRRRALVDADCVHLKGLRRLVMSACNSVTDAALVHLAGIQSLDMSLCDQSTITDAAFVHLAGVRSLRMRWCRQATITDAAFAPLAGIQSLDMSWCNQATITDAAFVPLAGIQSLDMSGCDQPTITGAAMAQLSGIQSLSVARCREEVIAAARARGFVK